jgi:small-conductance mechanosensitive channel
MFLTMGRTSQSVWWFGVLVLWVVLVGQVQAQPVVQSVPATFRQTHIMDVHYGAGSFSPSERAHAIQERVALISADNTFNVENLSLSAGEGGTQVSAKDFIITLITERDAKAENLDEKAYAEQVMHAIKTAIEQDRTDRSQQSLLLGILFALLETLALVILLYGMSIGRQRLVNWIVVAGKSRIPSLRIRTYEIFSSERVTRLIIWLVSTTRVFLIFLLLYFYVPLVLSLFSFTANFASKLFSFVMIPVHKVGHVILNFIPNLFYIAVILIVGSYFLSFLKAFFREIETGRVSFEGFHREWASPTYKLVRVLVIAFLFVATFPYLPGSSSPAFKGVTVFLGVLFSIGSGTSIGNITAGIILTYMRPFKVGDRVQISDTTGDVVEKTLLLTRIRTIKNVDVTIPNAMILASHIINYSTSAATEGLILHTTVTIGYDAEWKTVHELLLKAAAQTEGVIQTPKPFILQTSLDDFYVSYQLNVYTRQPNRMAVIESELHKNIQESFNAGGVEIMSPHYAALRDGNEVTIPSQSRAQGYEAPAFKVKL